MRASDIPEDGPFSPSIKLDIEQLAEGLSEDEVCLYLWGVKFEALDEPVKQEFMRYYTRGQVRFKIHAINSLKSQMQGRNGLQASLAALLRFADRWPTMNGADGDSAKFNFRITVDDD